MEYFNKKNMMLVLGCMFVFYIYSELTSDNKYLVRALNAHHKGDRVYSQDVLAAADFYEDTIDNLNKYWKYNSENIDNPFLLAIYVSAAEGSLGLDIKNKGELARKAIKLAPYDLDVYWLTYDTTSEVYERLDIIINHDTKDKFLLIEQIDYLFRYLKNYQSYSEYIYLDSTKENSKKGFEQLPKLTENLLLSADKYISLYPNSWVGYYKKGRILEHLKEKHNAQKYYTKAFSMYYPNSDLDLFEDRECRILKKMKTSLKLDKYNLCAPDIREMKRIHNYLLDNKLNLPNFDDFKKTVKSLFLKSFVICTGSKEVVVFFDPNCGYYENISENMCEELEDLFLGKFYKDAKEFIKMFAEPSIEDNEIEQFIIEYYPKATKHLYKQRAILYFLGACWLYPKENKLWEQEIINLLEQKTSNSQTDNAQALFDDLLDKYLQKN